MDLRILSGDDVRRGVPVDDAIEAMREAFGQVSGYQVDLPMETPVSGEGGVFLLQPGRLKESGAMGTKLVSRFEDNPRRDLPVEHSLLLLVDPETGRPRALLEAGELTALRTGAASALATDLLAVDDASVLVVFGAGSQARTQVECVRAVRPVEEVRIVSRSRESAEAFADEVEGVDVRVVDDPSEALKGARIVCTATTSATPVFDGGDVEPGTHVNAVGARTPDAREVDDVLVGRARVVVDSMDAAMESAGDIIGPIRRNVVSRASLYGELGEIVNGRRGGRHDDEQVTLFKSVGNTAQDLAVGRRAMEAAEEDGFGTVVEL